MANSKSARGNAKAKPVRHAAPAVQKSPTASKASKNTRRTVTQKLVTTDAPKHLPLSKAPAGTSKLEQIIGLLRRLQGASIAEICKATGWQTHSIRGAFAGTLKRKGHVITSDKVDDVRRYRIEAQL